MTRPCGAPAAARQALEATEALGGPAGGGGGGVADAPPGAGHGGGGAGDGAEQAAAGGARGAERAVAERDAALTRAGELRDELVALRAETDRLRADPVGRRPRRRPPRSRRGSGSPPPSRPAPPPTAGPSRPRRRRPPRPTPAVRPTARHAGAAQSGVGGAPASTPSGTGCGPSSTRRAPARHRPAAGAGAGRPACPARRRPGRPAPDPRLMAVIGVVSTCAAAVQRRRPTVGRPAGGQPCVRLRAVERGDVLRAAHRL